MFLLTKKNRHATWIAILSDQDTAMRLAQEFVGEHNPVDGCSTERRERLPKNGREYHVERNTSFGLRQASVIQLELDDEDLLLA